MSYRFVDSCRAGPGWNCSSILVLLDSCLKTCMTYTIAECTVNKLLMMDRRTSNRPSLSKNVNSTPGILRVVVTGNYNVYRPDTLRTIFILMWNTSMVSFGGGSASKVDDVTALPCHTQDGGYVLLWRYDNKMAAICYYGNVMATTRWRLCVSCH